MHGETVKPNYLISSYNIVFNPTVPPYSILTELHNYFF